MAVTLSQARLAEPGKARQEPVTGEAASRGAPFAETGAMGKERALFPRTANNQQGSCRCSISVIANSVVVGIRQDKWRGQEFYSL